MKYQTPFHLENGLIVDAEGKKVKLWGVNYYAPFNANFHNLEELGKDHFCAIDEDIRHFKLLGIDFIRMHFYDREITDHVGNIVENKNMRVLDYLLDQCEKNDIYLMITPIVWWNTVGNQIEQEQKYAFWYIGSQEAFGFSNFYSCDGMLWNEDAIRCQETYLKQLFMRKSTVNGRTLPEHRHVCVLELFNEPRFPQRQNLEEAFDSKPITQQNISDATWSRGEERRKLARRFEAFKKAHPEMADEDQAFSAFRREIVANYFNHLWPIVDEYFGKSGIIKAQFGSYNGLVPEDFRDLFENCGIDAVTIGTYLNVHNFDSVCTDDANHLELASKWFARFTSVPKGKLARIAYEFDATASLTSYPLAAIGAMYAKHEVQMAAYFTYTPHAVASWNPGWLVHFLNVAHTPARAAGFAAAGALFRQFDAQSEWECAPECWRSQNCLIDRQRDLVVFKSPHAFYYSNSNDEELPELSQLETVVGRGSSRFAASSANSCYFLRRESTTRWHLTIFPQHKYIADPYRGKAYTSMANRYVNCLKESQVSQLREDDIQFTMKVLRLFLCTGADGGNFPVAADGSVLLRPGDYTLEVRAR